MILKKNNTLLSIVYFIAILSFGKSALALQQPDAGQALQNLNFIQQAPKESPDLFFEAPKKSAKEFGGVRVKISSVAIKGNSVFKEKELLAALGEIKGKDFNMSDLQEMADKITAFYYKNNYPFARAFITKQAIQKGVLNIEIVEGRYGDVKIEGEETSQSIKAAKFLKNLNSDKVINGKELERTILLLNDQPGYKFIPVLSAGKTKGNGDLSLDMKETKRFGGSVKVDNYGNRYMGRNRATVSFYVNNPFTFGDQISVTSLYSTENLWYGAASYNLPLGSSGLRGIFSYSNVNYELGKEFKSLGQHGNVKILSSGLSYPIIRSQKTNLYITTSYQHKWLTDVQKSNSARSKKNSDVIPINFNFDTRDRLFGSSAVTYGMLGWTHGILDLGNRLNSIDRATAKTNGSFDKINFDINRLQALPVKDFTFFARATGQKSSQNLDSSERFALGGPNGVRAYPTGENYGDEGYLAQFELRYAFDEFLSPYIFYDQGHIKTNHTQWSSGANTRTIAGAGTGFRYNCQSWTTDATIAWRTIGDTYLSDNRAKSPMIWVSVAYKF
jgi:hemolysin activation/secretion protein